MRNDPLSLMNVSVCMFPRPDQFASGFQPTTWSGASERGGGAAEWQAAATKMIGSARNVLKRGTTAYDRQRITFMSYG